MEHESPAGCGENEAEMSGGAHLLLRDFVDAVDGGVEDLVAAVGQRAHGVEKQLGAVLAHDGDRPVAAAPRIGHIHVRPAVLERPATKPTGDRLSNLNCDWNLIEM